MKLGDTEKNEMECENMKNTDGKRKIVEAVERKSQIFTDLSDYIWELAETRFDLPRSADAIISVLEKEGFNVVRGLSGMDDAFAL